METTTAPLAPAAAPVSLTAPAAPRPPTFKATEALIRERLMSDDRWLERALVALWERQTADEQAVQGTTHLNHRGLSAFHACGFLGKMCQEAARRSAEGQPYGACLTWKQRAAARKCGIARYAGQLARIALGKAE